MEAEPRWMDVFFFLFFFVRLDRRHHAAGLLQLPVQRRERRHPSGEAGPVRGHELPSVALLCQLVAQHVPNRCTHTFTVQTQVMFQCGLFFFFSSSDFGVLCLEF